MCNKHFSRKYHLDRHVMQTGCDGKPKAAYPCQVSHDGGGRLVLWLQRDCRVCLSGLGAVGRLDSGQSSLLLVTRSCPVPKANDNMIVRLCNIALHPSNFD